MKAASSVWPRLRSIPGLRSKLPWLLALLVLTLTLPGLGARSASERILAAGFILLLSAAIRLLLSIREQEYEQARAGWLEGMMTLLLALVFLNASILSSGGLAAVISVWIVLSLIRMVFAAARPSLWWVVWVLSGVVASVAITYDFPATNGVVVIGIVLFDLLTAARRVMGARLREGDGSPASAAETDSVSGAHTAFRSQAVASEPLIRQVDNAWIIAITLVLFSIHLSRMGYDGSLGLLPAAVALIGDLVMALMFAFLVVIPARVWWMRVTMRYETAAVGAFERHGTGSAIGRALRFWVLGRMRFRLRLRQARFSMLALLRKGLIAGLPLSALITATVPLLGMSWFFDTEKWATISRDKWASWYVDDWRARMVEAVHPSPDRSLAVDMPGTDGGDFAFIVVGDPGQGGLAQRALAARLVEVSRGDQVRFVLISSDVVYPNGEMRDYESKFWAPFNGLARPVLAIPGNHDWYDGLDAFAATFFEADAARQAISVRKAGGVPDADSIAYAQALIAEAENLRISYRIPVRQQSSAYFRIVTDDFVLIAVDTGVIPGIDAMQEQWLRRALAEARGKTVMVVLGHPLFSEGRDRSLEQPGLARIFALLREERVSIVMAGDTHDFEHYRDDRVFGHTTHHFVNGGGGAYLSMGSAFGFPDRAPVDVWAYYPTRRAISEKIDQKVPPWAKPLWWWTREFDGYPLSAETLSSAFDFDKSPFLQSFALVRVERSARRIRIQPYGVDGRLRWRDFEISDVHPRAADEYAEWVIPMTAVR